jgi:hypothetical protein
MQTTSSLAPHQLQDWRGSPSRLAVGTPSVPGRDRTRFQRSAWIGTGTGVHQPTLINGAGGVGTRPGHVLANREVG